MKFFKNSEGFSPVVVVVILGIVGVLAFAGYNVYSRSQDKNTVATPASQSSSNVAATDVPTVKSAQDLKSAEKVVDQTNVDSSTEDSQLDADLAAF